MSTLDYDRVVCPERIDRRRNVKDFTIGFFYILKSFSASNQLLLLLLLLLDIVPMTQLIIRHLCAAR